MLAAAGDVAAANAVFKTAFASESYFRNILASYTLALYVANRLDTAAKVLDDHTNQFSPYPNSWAAYALVETARGNLAKALEVATKAAVSDDTYPSIKTPLAYLLAVTGQRTQAEEIDQ